MYHPASAVLIFLIIRSRRLPTDRSSNFKILKWLSLLELSANPYLKFSGLIFLPLTDHVTLAPGLTVVEITSISSVIPSICCGGGIMNGDSVNRLAETLTPFASQEKTVKSAGLIFLTINVDLSNSFLISYLSMLKIPLKICEM